MKTSYIQSIKLNGKKLERMYLSHSEIVNGGILVFEMAAKPNLEVNTFQHAPTITDLPKSFIPLPHFDQLQRVFGSSLTLSASLPMQIPEANFEIQYSVDGINWIKIEKVRDL